MIRLKNVTQIHSQNTSIAHKAVNDVSFDIRANNFVIILGQSGSGKTTLLNIIAGLLRPTSGVVEFDNKDIYRLNDKELANYRKTNIGFIFQNNFLDNNFNALENVLIPLFLQETLTKEQRIIKAKEVLKRVGLANKMHNKPTELSGGECQRVAIARALVNEPKIIIADEPTGNLDTKNGDAIIELLKELVSEKCSVIMVTHNQNYISSADVVISIADGKILNEKFKPTYF